MRLSKPLILLIVMLSCSRMFASSNIGLGATTYSRDTLALGDTLHITTYLKNYDTLAYNSTVTFGLKINGIQNVNPNIFPNPFLGQQLNLAPGDSVEAEMIVVVTPAYFYIGPDILVVWPIPTDGRPSRDTLIKEIIVIHPDSVHHPVDTTDTTGVGIGGPTPHYIHAWLQNGNFNMLSEGNDITLNRVSFYSITGECILNTPLDGNSSVPFENFPKGLYIANITYNGSEQKLVKFNK